MLVCELQAHLPCALPWGLGKAAGERLQAFRRHFAWQGSDGLEGTFEGVEDPFGRKVQVCSLAMLLRCLVGYCNSLCCVGHTIGDEVMQGTYSAGEQDSGKYCRPAIGRVQLS